MVVSSSTSAAEYGGRGDKSKDLQDPETVISVPSKAKNLRSMSTKGHTGVMKALCGICGRSQARLVCVRCAESMMISHRISMMMSAEERTQLEDLVNKRDSNDPDNENAIAAYRSWEMKKKSSEVRIRITVLKEELQRAQRELSEARDTLGKSRAYIESRQRNLRNATTTLRNANGLQADAIRRSLNKSKTKLSNLGTVILQERRKLVHDLITVSEISWDTRMGFWKIAGEKAFSAGQIDCQGKSSLTAVLRLSAICMLAASYFDVELPYEITTEPVLGILRRRRSYNPAEFRRLAVNQNVIDSLPSYGTSKRIRREIDAFLEAIALLVCDVVFLCEEDYAYGHQDDSLTKVEMNKNDLVLQNGAEALAQSANNILKIGAEEESVFGRLDIGLILCQTLTQFCSEEGNGGNIKSKSNLGSPNGKMLDPRVVLAAVRAKNIVDQDRRAWAEWQFVDADDGEDEKKDDDDNEFDALLDVVDVYEREGRTTTLAVDEDKGRESTKEVLRHVEEHTTKKEKQDKEEEREPWTDVRRRKKKLATADDASEDRKKSFARAKS
ncbi:UV radiation resistance protein and autophagy-related subunit 14-domain-containing protein [Dipodascopsis uninucleata]